MNLSRSVRRGVVLVALLALAAPLAAVSGNGKGGNDRGNGRVFYATDAANTLLQFSSNKPRKLRAKQITGLPDGVSIKGIDFRPASGDLYALGNNKVVYRLNPRTAIAIPEGPSFDRVPSILNGDNTGFDFNPTVDKIRVTCDARDRDALDELSAKHREVLELHYRGDLTQQQISERLEVPLGTVKTRTYHALRALKGKLEELELRD